MKTYGRTHTGMVRKNNQDSYLCKTYEGFALFGVADGLGGHNAGETASKAAAEAITKAVDECEKESFNQTADKLADFIIEANTYVYELSKTKQEYLNMGTTLCIGLAKNDCVTLYNIGDSRAYRVSTQIQQITKDHSLVQQLVDSRQINEEQAKNHPQKNVILRALGTESTVEADRFDIILNEGECILICSDGLTNNVEEKDILSVFKSYSMEDVPAELIMKANQNGGTDNITAVVYSFQ